MYLYQRQHGRQVREALERGESAVMQIEPMRRGRHAGQPRVLLLDRDRDRLLETTRSFGYPSHRGVTCPGAANQHIILWGRNAERAMRFLVPYTDPASPRRPSAWMRRSSRPASTS